MWDENSVAVIALVADRLHARLLVEVLYLAGVGRLPAAGRGDCAERNDDANGPADFQFRLSSAAAICGRSRG